jgi:hypothetical protein
MSTIFDAFVQKYGRLPTEFDPDYLEMLRMSKYRILDVPDVAPAKCANCGSTKSDGRKYVDFGLQVDWYGVVYLCGLCLGEIARKMGLFSQVEQALADSLVYGVDKIKGLQEQGVNLHDTVVKTFKEFEEFYAGLYSFGMDRNPNDPSGIGTSEAAANKSGITEPKSRTSKSTSSSGSQDVRSLTDLLNVDK